MKTEISIYSGKTFEINVTIEIGTCIHGHFKVYCTVDFEGKELVTKITDTDTGFFDDFKDQIYEDYTKCDQMAFDKYFDRFEEIIRCWLEEIENN